LLGIKVWV